MKAQTKTAAVVFGGVAAVALTVGLGGLAADPTGGAAATATHSSSSIATARTEATGAGGHLATLASCVSGLDC